MRTKRVLILFAVVLFLAATPVFAQGTAASGGVGGELKALGAVVGMGIAAGLCGIGQGKAVASSVEGIARNPSTRAAIQTVMILGLAFIESLAIFTFLIVFART